ncbi:MAG: hypothetical protein MJ224_04435 [archaeon]|nr:hypothetical protein [archaeon]
MLKHNYNDPCDLRRKTTFGTYMRYNNFRLNFSDCMVILLVFAVLLFSVIAVSATPDPTMIMV